MVLYHCFVFRYGLEDYGIQLNIREVDEAFSYFGNRLSLLRYVLL
jgi:hypothetical protein